MMGISLRFPESVKGCRGRSMSYVTVQFVTTKKSDIKSTLMVIPCANGALRAMPATAGYLAQTNAVYVVTSGK